MFLQNQTEEELLIWETDFNWQLRRSRYCNANFLEYSKNYRKTTGSFWNYYRDEPNNPPLNDDDPPTINYNADPITNSESFKYKSSITGKTSNANQENGENAKQGNTKTKRNLEIVVPLKYLSNFWRTLYMPLINCEVCLTLTWSENCVLTNTKHKLQQQLKEIIQQGKE